MAASVFAIIALGVYQAFFSLSGLAQMSKTKAEAMALATEQLEIVRNLPYSDVGIIGGWPVGKIPYEKHESRAGINFLVTTTIRSIDDPFDGTIDGSPNDINPADYKLVAVEVTCDTSLASSSCRYFSAVSLTTQVAPKNLETSSGNGALFVKVIDANGQPVSGAKVKVTNTATSTLVINDSTNNSGLLQLVDLPPGELAYKVEVTKTGYSSASIDPQATILAGKLTQLSLVIDKLSSLQIKTIDQFCQPAGPFTLRLRGAETTDPEGTILRYDNSQTIPASGELILNELKWDTYRFTPSDAVWKIVGSFPLQSVLVPPGATSEVKLLLGQDSGQGLLVAAKDGASALPLSDVSVTLTKSGIDQTLVTSRGFFRDTDWSTGSNETDGQVEVREPIGEMKLTKVLDLYNPSAYLISKTFDAGTASTTYYNLVWQPADQASSTGPSSIRFQLATSNDPATNDWQFLGPDGTTNSYYAVANSNINEVHNNKRYLKYKVYLNTTDRNFSPNISDVAITYSSECLPFGQVFFRDLSTGTYEVVATKSGYQDYHGQITIGEPWQILEITLNPQ